MTTADRLFTGRGRPEIPDIGRFYGIIPRRWKVRSLAYETLQAADPLACKRRA